MFVDRRVCYRVEWSTWKWASKSGKCFVYCWYKK